MKKILLPTDFSPASQTSLETAVRIGSVAPVEIFALNVFEKKDKHPSPDVSLLMRQEAEKKHKAALVKFTGKYPHLDPSGKLAGFSIHNVIRQGNVVDEIVAFSEEQAVDLILIGTKSKHNYWEYLFGSITTRLVKKSVKPVLIVPEGLWFEPPKKIAFANDFATNNLPLENLEAFAALFDADIEQVHVNVLPSDFSNLKEEVVENPEGGSDEDKFRYTRIIRNPSIKKGLDHFIHENQIDLLALYLPQRTFTENLLRRSLTRQFALDSKIPLLIFKE